MYSFALPLYKFNKNKLTSLLHFKETSTKFYIDNAKHLTMNSGQPMHTSDSTEMLPYGEKIISMKETSNTGFLCLKYS